MKRFSSIVVTIIIIASLNINCSKSGDNGTVGPTIKPPVINRKSG